MAWIPPGPAFCFERYLDGTLIGSAGARNGPLTGAVGEGAMYRAVGAYTNPPPLVVIANANRRLPGVNTPVAAPSSPVALTRLASWVRLRPSTDGNWVATGRTAAGSSFTAAGGPD